VLARLFKLPALVLDFIEQADVFDGDNRLVRESLSQLNLLSGERSWCGATYVEYADGCAFPHQWHAKQSTISTYFLAFDVVIFRIG
jgi:hypothetical protein